MILYPSAIDIVKSILHIKFETGWWSGSKVSYISQRADGFDRHSSLIKIVLIITHLDENLINEVMDFASRLPLPITAILEIIIAN